MKNYIVELNNGSLTGSGSDYFKCQAEDVEHAKEQALDYEPDMTVHKVYEETE